jgi:hypothetical protein
MPIEDRLHLPCWGCIVEPQASDTRRWLANCSDSDYANQQSPISKLPLGCCRIRTVGAFSESDATRAPRTR